MIYSKVCISDADVLIKLCNAGHIEILGLMFEEVIIPEKVYLEVVKKLEHHKDHFVKVIKEKLIKVMNLSDLELNQRQGIDSFLISYRDSLDDGELHATALANELGIRLMLTDDRNATRLIQFCTDIMCVTHWEYICLCISEKKLSPQDGQAVFEKINALVSHPISVQFVELMKRAELKFKAQSA